MTFRPTRNSLSNRKNDVPAPRSRLLDLPIEIGKIIFPLPWLDEIPIDGNADFTDTDFIEKRKIGLFPIQPEITCITRRKGDTKHHIFTRMQSRNIKQPEQHGDQKHDPPYDPKDYFQKIIEASPHKSITP